MAMPVVVPRYTLQDLESFPDDGNRYELVDGLLLVTPGPAPPHEVVVSELFGRLDAYLRPDQIARVFTRGTIEVAPKHHLEPDLLVVPTDALAGALGLEARWTDIQRWWLAVEVSGRESTVYDRDVKGPAYLALGIREYWRVDLREQSAFVRRPGDPAEQRQAERLIWHPPGREAPLVIPIPDLFA